VLSGECRQRTPPLSCAIRFSWLQRPLASATTCSARGSRRWSRRRSSGPCCRGRAGPALRRCSCAARPGWAWSNPSRDWCCRFRSWSTPRLRPARPGRSRSAEGADRGRRGRRVARRCRCTIRERQREEAEQLGKRRYSDLAALFDELRVRFAGRNGPPVSAQGKLAT
jgi:hypothetical protein